MVVRRVIRTLHPRTGGLVCLERLDRPDPAGDAKEEYRIEFNGVYFMNLSRDELATIVVGASELLNGALE